MWFLKINISSTKSSVFDFDKHNGYKVDIEKNHYVILHLIFLRSFSWSLSLVINIFLQILAHRCQRHRQAWFPSFSAYGRIQNFLYLCLLVGVTSLLERSPQNNSEISQTQKPRERDSVGTDKKHDIKNLLALFFERDKC